MDASRASADLFITLDKVWPDGHPPAADVARIFLRKPDAPFSTITIGDTGETERIWTSFGTADWSEQIDLDVTSAATRNLITRWLAAVRGARRQHRAARRRRVRDQEARDNLLHGRARDLRVPRLGDRGRRLLRARHPPRGPRWTTPPTSGSSAHGFWTYDFVLPGLLLHAFETGETTRLAEHLARIAGPAVHNPRLPRRHPRSPGPRRDPDASRDGRPRRARPSTGRQREPHPVRRARRGGDVHQLNCTYYSALGEDDERYLAARAIQLFARGFHRSTTSACWRARTTTPPSTGRERAARSIATTTPRARSKRHLLGPS